MRTATILLLASCSYYRTVGNDVDAPPPDAAPPIDAAIGTCASSCGAPNSQTVCVQGYVCDFTDPSRRIAPAEAQALRVRIYDPIALATNPTIPAVATVTIDADGCFVADGIQRFPSGLISWTVDDAGPDDRYSPLAGGAAALANQNVLGVKAYAVLRTTVADWQTEVGTVAGCASLEACGIWIGEYVDRSGLPVAGVTPTRPGDNPLPANTFCFRGDRFHLSTEDTTDGTGLCAISPDSVEGHAGMCVGAGCTGTWSAIPSGVAPGLIMLQRFVAQ